MNVELNGAVLAEIWLIPFTGDLQGNADQFENSAKWSRSEKYGTNGSFLGKSDTALSFPLFLERSEDEFPLKMAAEKKWAFLGPDRHFLVQHYVSVFKFNQFCSVLFYSIGIK